MTKQCKSCHSCAMPMDKPEDFAPGHPGGDYCRYCTDSTGKLLPFEAVLKMNADCYVESQGLEPAAARQMALTMLKAQPAWKGVHA